MVSFRSLANLQMDIPVILLLKTKYVYTSKLLEAGLNVNYFGFSLGNLS